MANSLHYVATTDNDKSVCKSIHLSFERHAELNASKRKVVSSELGCSKFDTTLILVLTNDSSGYEIYEIVTTSFRRIVSHDHFFLLGRCRCHHDETKRPRPTDHRPGGMY